MQPAVERSAVRTVAGVLGLLSVIFLVAAVVSGSWVWWLAAGETTALMLLAFLPMTIGKCLLPTLLSASVSGNWFRSRSYW